MEERIKKNVTKPLVTQTIGPDAKRANEVATCDALRERYLKVL